MGRAHDRMAVRGKTVAAVLVGHQEQDVRLRSGSRLECGRSRHGREQLAPGQIHSIHLLIRQARKGNRSQGRASIGLRPAPEKLQSSAANATLTRAHSATSLELGFSPTIEAGEARPRHVFASAYECLRLGYSTEFIAQAERVGQDAAETAVHVDRRSACDKPFADGHIDTADSADLSRRKDARHRSPLPVIDRDETVGCQIAPQQLGGLLCSARGRSRKLARRRGALHRTKAEFPPRFSGREPRQAKRRIAYALPA